MLVAMEIALGVLLGVLGVSLAVFAAFLVGRRTRPGRPASPRGPEPAADDLPGFLEAPPGTTASSSARAGWAALAPQPVGRTDDQPRRRDRSVAPGAVAAVGILLIALAVAVLTRRDDSRHHGNGADGQPRDVSATPAGPAPGPAEAGSLSGESVPPGSDGVVARLTFDGVVLERHAVGVTAAYPGLEVTSDGERSLAHLELPTFHCLSGEAPPDPTAAGCRRSATEYADLGSPALSLTGSDDLLRLSGDFAMYLRPRGSSPEWTGRVYRIEVSVNSTDGAVEGYLDLGDERTAIAPDPAVNLLRRGS